MAHCADGSLPERYHRLPVPSAYVHGDANRGLPHLEATGRASTQLVEIPDADHFPFVDQPSRFYAAIAHFADGAEAASAQAPKPAPV